MRFRGQLVVSAAAEGIVVDLRLDEERLEVTHEGEVLGSWSLNDVDIERVGGEEFVLTLEGEPVNFTAEDVLAMAYQGMPHVESFHEHARRRGLLRRLFRRSSRRPGGWTARPEQVGLVVPDSALGTAPADPEPLPRTGPTPAPTPDLLAPQSLPSARSDRRHDAGVSRETAAPRSSFRSSPAPPNLDLARGSAAGTGTPPVSDASSAPSAARRPIARTPEAAARGDQLARPTRPAATRLTRPTGSDAP